jgi:hypothetical protein
MTFDPEPLIRKYHKLQRQNDWTFPLVLITAVTATLTLIVSVIALIVTL